MVLFGPRKFMGKDGGSAVRILQGVMQLPGTGVIFKLMQS